MSPKPVGKENDDFLFTQSAKDELLKTQGKDSQKTCYGNIEKQASFILYFWHDNTKNWLRKSFNPRSES